MTLQRAVLSLAPVALLAILPISLPAQAAATDKPQAPNTTVPAQPSFEIADVHPSPYTFQSNYFHWNPQGTDRFLLHQASLVDLIAFAYKLENDHIFGGPTWLTFDHFDIVAKQPPGTPVDTSRLMLRALLAERFHLVSHNDTKPLPAQLLTVAKGGLKMKPAADTTVPSDCQFHPPDPPPAPDAPPPSSFFLTCRNMTMEQFANQIPRWGPTERYPIIDQTGVKGAWDFDITYHMLPSRTGLDVANDLEKLGLKLAIGETPQPVLDVDSLIETPTPNAPNLAELLPPPPPPAFEVAVVRPSPPDATGDMNLFFNPSGDVRITHATLQRMIGEAYDISGAGIDNIPDFLAKDHWDVVAKIPQDVYPKNKNGSPDIPYDDIQLMLRSLLAERFGMKAHFEDRPNDTAWILTAANPKLKKAADPTMRTSCDNMPPPGEKDPRAANPIRNRAMWCHNVTMDQLANQLMYFALDYIKSPVLNATHIEGSYDIELNWSTSRVARGVEGIDGRPVRNDPGGDPSQPAEPTGAISLPDAISKQLGLKLEQQKRDIPMLVLDHIERNPTEN
ncbi:MAG TPA: TIGR03435 family protein [Acidobacteriaceae bacterium]|nr:TIGR03435 family protein [Acidobacteriaceae bacterium]